jgi:hypothetical protein
MKSGGEIKGMRDAIEDGGWRIEDQGSRIEDGCAY